MQLMLRKASHALYLNGKMTHEQMHNYRMAVTEREVINGCLSMEDGPYLKDHVIIYSSRIKELMMFYLSTLLYIMTVALFGYYFYNKEIRLDRVKDQSREQRHRYFEKKSIQK